MNSKQIDEFGQRAEQTLKETQAWTGTLSGRIYTWFSGSISAEMPDWAREHIVATRELKHVVTLAERRGEKIPEHIVSLLNACKTEVRNLALLVNNSEYLNLVLEREPKLSPEGLLVGREKIIAHEFEWQLNVGLMMNVYNRTSDPALKKQISFLVVQYLAKAAPIEPYGFTGKDPFESHLGFFMGQTYHREYSIFEKYLTPTIEKAFVPESMDAMLFVDTKECQRLFPISYTVINDTQPSESLSIEEAWGEKIADAMSPYLERGEFKQFLDPPLVFDFTEDIGDSILRSPEEDREGAFKAKKRELEQKIERALDEAVERIRIAHPELKLSREALKAMIRANTSCLSRHEVSGVGAIRILPFLNQPEQFEALEDEIAGSRVQEVIEGRLHMLETFLNKTGLRLGAVHARSALFEHIDLEQLLKYEKMYSGRGLKLTEYAPTGENVLYYPEKSDITGTHLFKTFESRLGGDEFLDHPEVAVQGRATLNLFKGLLSEISDSKWKELHDNPETRMLVQGTLFRFMQHLARAEHNMNMVETSFEARTAFAKSMELAQAEISTLLSVVSPFSEEDFEEIYTSRLTHIPEELRGYVQVGVGKSAMNVFSGINMLVGETTAKDSPERVISEGTYFEEVNIIGENHSPDEALKNPAVKTVDLYAGEFNHNVNIDLRITHYEPADVIGEVEALLKNKPETERLTVSIDQTIDFVRSKNVAALLERFSDEIAEGKLNFVFFRSGQKFDMLGMDHYYGSPFYMVNNGDAHWQAFDTLATNPLFKTDPLSMQWFSLANKYGFEDMEDYRGAIFQNTRAVLDRVPESLKPGNNPNVRVGTASKQMDASFIDVKCISKGGITATELSSRLVKKFHDHNQTIHGRSSFGFPHTNYTAIIDPTDGVARTLRINVGLDPADIDLITEFLEELASDLS